MGTVKKGVNFVRNSLKTLNSYRYTTVAGTLVFFLIMSFVPLTFFLSSLLSSFHLNIDKLLELPLFEWARELLLFFRNNAEGTGVASIFFIVTTFWSGSSFFYHLRRSGEIIYDYRREKKGWRVRLSAFLLTLLVLIFLVVCIAGLLATVYFTANFPRWLSYIIIYSVLSVIGFFTAWLLNHYLCPYRIYPKKTAKGSFFTAISWLLASICFAIYLNFSKKERLYGALTAVIVFFLWLYWMMICFTAGVVYNRHKLMRERLEHKQF